MGELFLKKGERSKASNSLETAESILEQLALMSPENAVSRQDLETVKKHLQ